jgi:hypothetical protein
MCWWRLSDGDEMHGYRRRLDAVDKMRPPGGTTGGERQAVAVQHDKAMVKQLHV